MTLCVEANYVNPHSVINIAHSGGIKGRNNGNRYTMQAGQGGRWSDTHEQCWFEMQGCQRWLLLLPRRKLNRAPVGRALSGRGRRVMKRS